MTAAGSPRSALVSRAIVTVLTAGGFAAFCWADATGLLGAPPAWWLAPVAALLGWCGAAEAVRLAAARGHDLDGRLLPPATALVPIAAAAAATVADGPAAIVGWAAVATFIALGAMLTVEVARYRPAGGGLVRVAGGFFVVAAVGMPLAFMVGLRLLGGPRGLVGMLPLVSMVAVVKGGDIAAYVVGSLVGRHKLAPLVSPGKTWEGAAASVAASLVVAWLVLGWSAQAGGGQPWGGWPVYGLAVGVAGMLGDLSESLVKRELGAKDSGRSLGGLGGVLDLVDATLLAAPVAWLAWVFGGPSAA
ncbi:MAG: phosphatidate cytidylyltransferase [Planctomycetota bacterium]